VPAEHAPTPVGRDLDAVSFDALGTLIRLEDPAPRLREGLRMHLGLDVPIDRCETAMKAEMAHYRARCRDAVDRGSLAAIRLECAWVLADVLALGPGGPELLPALGDAIAYRVFPDAAYALDRLHEAGLRLAVLSNWDVSLHDALRRLGLTARFATVTVSAEIGAEKPDRAAFAAVAEGLGAVPHRILHVGDDPVRDVDGALAAGFRALLVQRDAGPAARRPRVATLAELPALLDLDHGSPDG
jgi:putative hydrolase of the HAD superfamily